ncbi:hypothetical protein BDN70DRAFT_877915 [Pholiota conissans]|uniref:BTB domain-containing protein n=1 Tax=Pholiota conissans TaxID=109636 RepID=A0A9P5Z557_9AGAR|nr:hypothetical protein BDN70DRAFT_877915 [Pholiota conissans]
MTISSHFDSADADVILLTTEADCSTEFHVHKCILAAASSFFSDMFSLPQETAEELPIIPVTETSSRLDTILRCIYPVPDPVVETLDELAGALGIAIKYDFTTALSALRKQLVSRKHLLKSPIRVYAIACHYELEEEAQTASRHTLNVNLLDAVPCKELKNISGYDYHRLLTLHRRRSAAALELIKAPVDLKCMHCNTSAFTCHDAPKWWYEFERGARVELGARPTTDVIFGMEFLFKAARASGCMRCPESVLNSWKFLESLKAAIDALPSTVTCIETCS